MRQQPNTLPQSSYGQAEFAPLSRRFARGHQTPSNQPGTPARRFALMGWRPARRSAARSRPAALCLLCLMALAGLLLLPPAHVAQARTIENPGADSDHPTREELVLEWQGGVAPAQAKATGGRDQARSEILKYAVQSGDTLYGIAEHFGIDAETLIWANDMESHPDMLSLGQELWILPVSGVLHVVKSGDTLDGISRRYEVDLDAIRNLAANHLEGENPLLQIGQQIIVPGGVKPRPVAQAAAPAKQPVAQAVSAPAPANAPAGSTHFIWPVSSYISQGFRAYHRALDVGADSGVPVKASDSGYVAAAGWSNVGYGNYVVVDHGNGFRTLYAHLSRIDVAAGQAVQQGAVIGAVGATGNATGPHLHFELLQNGVQRNPGDLLP